MEESKVEKKPVAIAFDSNLLSYLSVVSEIVDNDLTLDPEKTNPYVYQNYKRLATIYNAINNGDIIPVVTKTVYCETLNISKIQRFIKIFCKSPVYDTMAQSITSEHKVKSLAVKYTEPYVDDKGRKRSAPFEKLYDAETDNFRIPNDAYNMAEATVAGVLFATANSKHFIKAKKSDVNDIAYGIMNINVANGYNQDGEYGIPRPIGVHDLARFCMSAEGVKGPDPTVRLAETIDISME